MLWTDQYIFGTTGYYFVRMGDIEAGYFSTLAKARAYLRSVRRAKR